MKSGRLTKLTVLLTAIAVVSGGCSHTQQQPERKIYVISEDASGVGSLEVAIGTVVIVGGLVAAPYVIAVVGGALVLAPL